MNTIAKVESLLSSYCLEKIQLAEQIHPRYVALWQEIERYLAGGGKRMRPQLVLLAYDAYKKHDTDITHIAAAWELLHACLLVHDDIIDRDTLRHGRPNIAGRYHSIYGELGSSDTPHYALSAALLGGDLLLMSAYEIINSSKLRDDQKLLAQSYLNRAIFTVAGGELIDTDAVLYPISESNPLAVARYKTASYSLQMPLQCGAALTEAPSKELDKLHAIGLHTGIAYQLKDDLLGVFGDSATTGKSNRSDIAEKKRTFLVHKAIENLNEAQANELTTLFAPDHTLTPVEIERIVELIESSGAKDSTESRINEESKQALDIIDSLEVSDEHKQIFKDLVSKLTVRTS